MLAIAGLGGLLILSAFAAWGFFALLWLKNGEWPIYTAINGYCWAFGCAEESWAYWPHDWLGIHKALTWLSPAGALFWLGIAVVWLSLAAAESTGK